MYNSIEQNVRIRKKKSRKIGIKKVHSKVISTFECTHKSLVHQTNYLISPSAEAAALIDPSLRPARALIAASEASCERLAFVGGIPMPSLAALRTSDCPPGNVDPRFALIMSYDARSRYFIAEVRTALFPSGSIPSAYWSTSTPTIQTSWLFERRVFASLITPTPTPPAAANTTLTPLSYMEAASCCPAATSENVP